MNSTIIRTPRNGQFLVVSHTPLKDIRLNWDSRGLLVFLLSKPDDWTVNVEYLIKQAPSGRDKIYRMLKELITFGYIERQQKRNPSGNIEGYIYFVYELPLSPYPDKPEPGTPDSNTPIPETQENLLTTDTNYVCSSSTTTNKSVESSEEQLITPSTLSKQETEQAINLVSQFQFTKSQQLLDELTGIINDGKLRSSPIACLTGLVNKECKGEFNPARGVKIATARIREKRLSEFHAQHRVETTNVPENWNNDPLKMKLDEIGKLLN